MKKVKLMTGLMHIRKIRTRYQLYSSCLLWGCSKITLRTFWWLNVNVCDKNKSRSSNVNNQEEEKMCLTQRFLTSTLKKALLIFSALSQTTDITDNTGSFWLTVHQQYQYSIYRREIVPDDTKIRKKNVNVTNIQQSETPWLWQATSSRSVFRY